MHIREACRWGIVDGATTNPTLVSKTGREPRELYAEICRIVPGPVSLECMATEADAIVAEAKQLATIAENVVVKVPLIREGLIAVKQLAALGIKTNVTVVCSPLQALLAAKCGATFVSPFVGRWDWMGHVGMDMIRQIKTIYDNYSFSTQILVASVRHPLHVLESALAGAHVCHDSDGRDAAALPPSDERRDHGSSSTTIGRRCPEVVQDAWAGEEMSDGQVTCRIRVLCAIDASTATTPSSSSSDRLKSLSQMDVELVHGSGSHRDGRRRRSAGRAVHRPSAWT